jgi:hypothetical protein
MILKNFLRIFLAMLLKNFLRIFLAMLLKNFLRIFLAMLLKNFLRIFWQCYWESGFKCKSCDYEKDTYGRPLINFHAKWAKEQEWRESGKFPYRIRKLDEYLEFAGERRKDSKTSMEFAQQHQAKRQRV